MWHLMICSFVIASAVVVPLMVAFEGEMPISVRRSLSTMDDAFENGWQGLSAFRWGAADVAGARVATPAAGWNLCSLDHREYGFFEEVCIFDGDVFIAGLPYRTAELNRSSSSYQDRRATDLNLDRIRTEFGSNSN